MDPETMRRGAYGPPREGDIDPSMLHTAYPSEIFYALWRSASFLPDNPPPDDQVYEYTVTQTVQLYDVNNTAIQFNSMMPQALSVTSSEIEAISNYLFLANEFAMILHCRLQAALRAHFIVSIAHCDVRDGCIHIFSHYNGTNIYSITVTKIPAVIDPELDMAGGSPSSSEA
ncbi:hypothetical protein ONZ43_g3494 [Nemania bipapillata]|uniref:Uncharacterized protein n=1 Tax=Nemania bipapillata TaxID=110536 RepID=A0ACC2IWI3_9PEZI|nr:hypothetical protein ONZ43_g3494 [Nemania bipapillata]